MMVGLFYFIFQFRKRKIQEELEKLKSIHLERERIISDLHDELGGSLNSIQLISSLILNNNLNNEKILECISKIEDTSKIVSQQIKMVIWSLDTQNDTLLSLIEYIKQYTKQFLNPTHFNLKFQNHYLEQDIPISGFFRKNIFLVVKEILNNCVKHANATEVIFTILVQNNLLTITIKDNGKGIQNNNPFGNGLNNITKRIKSLNGTLNIKNDNGALISFNIPFVLI